MKTIRIFALPSHVTKERVTGVDFARINQPMSHLNGYSDGEVEFKVTIYDPKVEELHSQVAEWIKVAEEHDIIYFNYLNNPWGFAAMGAMARAKGRPIVMDLDDSLWNIKSDNSAYTVYKKGSEAINNFTLICNEVDYITCTNEYLKHVIMNNTNKRATDIEVFPNYVDLKLYSHRSPFKDRGQVQLLHYGSSTHYVDLQAEEFYRGIDRIMKEYPNVNIKFIGAFIPQFKARWGVRYDHAFGDSDIYKWVKNHFPRYMDESDILVVPLSDDIYNRSKSSIKFIESASAKIPGVFQDIRQYSEVIQHGKNGFLATKSGDWYKAIKKLIDDPKLRQSVGEEAFKTVEKDWQMQAHVEDYAKFFKSIL